MNQITYKIACLLTLMALALPAASATPEAEYGKLAKSWTLHADGSQELRCNQELTLFTLGANSRFGETFIVYNPDYQELKINAAYTRQKDGTIVKTPDNAFVEVLPRHAADAPAFNQLKEMVVVHTGLEPEATVYLDYTLLTRPGYYPALDLDACLAEKAPVKEYTLSLTVPENKELAWQLYGANGRPTETRANGQHTLRWVVKNIPALSHEAFQPQNGNDTPRLLASTAGSAQAALALLKARFEASQSYESKAFAAYLTEKAASDKEKIDLLRNHVVKNLSTSRVPLENTGYTVRDADAVLRSAYGTEAEKTQLLNILLNAAGIQAEVVAVFPALFQPEAMGLSALKSLAVRATVDGKACYLSAVSSETPAIGRRGELDKVYRLNGEEIAVKAEPVVVKVEKEVTVKAEPSAGGYVVCTLPATAEGVDSWRAAALNSRRTGMMEIPARICQEVTYTVTPEEGLKLQSPTSQVSLVKPCGQVSRTLTEKDGKIEVVRRIELNRMQYTPAEYNDLRALLQAWNDPSQQILLFSAQ